MCGDDRGWRPAPHIGEDWIPTHQHCCTCCHTTLLPRAGNGIRQAMGARSRGLCGQTETPAVAAYQYIHPNNVPPRYGQGSSPTSP
eukprot:5460444-Prymnesium_polylepis.1